ncbi:MAG: hypothetical protein WCE70_04250, partial [Rhodanobacteraceae bacterium]
MSLLHTPLAAGIALLGSALLVHSMRRTLRVVRTSVVVRLPAVAEQEVEFEQPGRFILCVEHSRFDGGLLHARYALLDAAGRELPSVPVFFRTTVSGIASVRISLRAFAVAEPGRHRLIVTGMTTGGDVSSRALVFTRPFAVRLVFCILGILFGGCALVGGTVLT